jgi:hypothetical protein
MAGATLSGTVKIKTSDARRQLNRLKKAGRAFSREFGKPMAAATRNLTRLAAKTSLVAGLLSGMGTKKAFDFETMETQFEMLFRNTAKAKKHVKDMADLSAVTPFDVEPFIQASRLLQTMGGEVLNNKEFITQMGDAAAMAGQDVQQVAEWIGRTYASLKSGSGAGRGARMLSMTGIINPEEFAKLKDIGKDASNFGQAWGIVQKALDRAKGSMERMSKTGNGLFSTMKGLISLSMADTFKSFGDTVKNVINQININLNKLRDNGTLKQWGAEIGDTAKSIINNIWAIAKGWQNLNVNTRSQLKNMALVATAGFAAWKLGFLVPMVKGIAMLSFFALKNYKAIAQGGAFLATAIAGYQFGKTIGESLNLSYSVGAISIGLQAIFKLFWATLTNVTSLAILTGKEVYKALTFKDTDFKGVFSGWLDNYKSEMKNVVAEGKISAKAWENFHKQTPDKKVNFFDQLKKNFNPNQLKFNLKDWLPAGINEFVAKIGEAREGLKFPEMQKLDPLDEQLNLDGAIKKADELNKKTGKRPLRGIITKVGTSASDAARNSLKKAKDFSAKAVVNRGVMPVPDIPESRKKEERYYKEQNTLLSDIKDYVGDILPAVHNATGTRWS